MLASTSRKEKENPTIFGNILPASVNVGLDHDASDRAVASNQLLADGIDDLRLIVVVLERVPVCAGVMSGNRGSCASSDVREQSIIMLGLYWGRDFSRAAETAFTCSAS